MTPEKPQELQNVILTLLLIAERLEAPGQNYKLKNLRLMC